MIVNIGSMVCVLGAVAMAATVDLRGKVSDAASGKAISGAVVVLGGQGLKDTTGSDGMYALVSEPSAVGMRDARSSVAMDGGALVLSMEQAAAVRIDVLDVVGNRLRDIRLDRLESGSHRLPVLDGLRTNGLLLVRVSIDGRETSFRVLPNTGRMSVSVMPAARAAAVSDTLRVSATGYSTKNVPVSSYEQTLDVSLNALSVCNPADKTPDPVSVNVSNAYSPLTGSHQVVVETDPSLREKTIYRPKDLAPGKNYPILIWGNGGCSMNATDHTDFHLEIASHGYVIVADGNPKGSGSRSMGDVVAMGKTQIDALNWAIQQNSKPCSRFFQALDTLHIGGFGWSCGGLMTYGFTLDRRVTASIVMNSGLLNADQTMLDRMRVPIAYVCGGPDDMAYVNGQRDFTNIKTVPTVFANVGVGHGGTYYSDNGGEYSKFVRAWFDWWLKGDTGANGKLKFTDRSSAFFKSPWTMETKRLP
ncbi:MAG TPA: hypothetical protein PK208_00660 [Fibrobacteria bacterium]|nr:hypothetical protein [Fibrobacteria bacterium]